MSVYVHHICSRVGSNMWWRCGKENVTCVRCARWLRPVWRLSWQHHSIWTCLDPHTTGLATTLCAHSPLRVRNYVHSELSVVMSCVVACSAMLFTIYLKCLLSLSQSFPSSSLISSEKALLIVEKEITGIKWCVIKVVSWEKNCLYQ